MNHLLARLHAYRQCPPSKALPASPPPTAPPPSGRLFDLGATNMTPGIEGLVTSGALNPGYILRRHNAGDWGDLEADDKALNDRAVIDGSRIFSSYILPCGKVWCITEATDDAGKRSRTTILLPDEY